MGLLNPICKYDYMFIWLNTLLDIRVQGLFQKEKKGLYRSDSHLVHIVSGLVMY